MTSAWRPCMHMPVNTRMPVLQHAQAVSAGKPLKDVPARRPCMPSYTWHYEIWKSAKLLAKCKLKYYRISECPEGGQSCSMHRQSAPASL